MTDSDYPWEVIPDPDAGGYVIRFPDLPGCMSQVENLYDVNSTAAEIRDLWLATAREAGMAIPEPGSHEAGIRLLQKAAAADKRYLDWQMAVMDANGDEDCTKCPCNKPGNREPLYMCDTLTDIFGACLRPCDIILLMDDLGMAHSRWLQVQKGGQDAD